jgi:hypothetical protein
MLKSVFETLIMFLALGRVPKVAVRSEIFHEKKAVGFFSLNSTTCLCDVFIGTSRYLPVLSIVLSNMTHERLPYGSVAICRHLLFRGGGGGGGVKF